MREREKITTNPLKGLKEQFSSLLRYRFDEKNREMRKRFLEEKQRCNARGILYSSETVKAMHKVLKTEFQESVDIVVTTEIDVISKNGLLPAEKKLQMLCSEAISQKKDEVEALYLSAVRPIEKGLLNTTLLKPYMSLRDFYDLQREEMLISLSHAYGEYKRHKGVNLADAIKNRFLNHPIVAWTTVVLTVIIVVATLVGKIDGLLSQNVDGDADVKIKTHEN